MASWVFCNYCFQSPSRKSSFSLTSCGHVYCDSCLGKGKKDECLICKVPCRTVLLSKHTDSDIQAFFMGIDGLCRKYSQETSQSPIKFRMSSGYTGWTGSRSSNYSRCQSDNVLRFIQQGHVPLRTRVSEFQEKHRRRLLAFYRAKISRLEESLRTLVLQVEQLQSVRSSQHTAFNTVKNSVSTQPSGRLLLPPHSSVPDRVELMEVDLAPSPVRKPEVAAGPTRISLISPPQDGRMGSISYPGPPRPSLTPSQVSTAAALRVPPVPSSCKGLSPGPAPQPPGRADGGSSAQARPLRPPISISGLLQRQCLGKCSAAHQWFFSG